MQAKGLYGGSMLWVDLSENTHRIETTDLYTAQKYIGGWGMNARLAYDLITPGMDAWDPATPMIFGTGVLTGAMSPGTPKSFLTTKDKASGTVVTSVGSLLFGTMLKWAGYDHLIIRGASDTPKYLEIIDDQISLRNASDLWGLDIMQTTDKLKNRYGHDHSVLAIGPAGENLVPISIMFNDYCSTFGRSFGGNFGFRKLKAIVVKGTKGTRLADRRRFSKAADALAARALKDPLRPKWTNQGLYFVFPMWVKAGYFSTNNFREVIPEKEAFDIYGAQHFDRVKKRVIGCPSCLSPDKFLWEPVDENGQSFKMMLSVPIDPAMSFGIRQQVGDFDKASWLFAEANRLGVDAMTLSGLISFTTNLYERGAITAEDTGGLELKPGFETVKIILDLTARKEGFGAVLAEGFEGVIAKFGHAEDAYQVKGTEPDFDARASLGVEVFGSVVNPRAAHDMPVGGLTVAKGREPAFFKKVVSKVGYVPSEAMNRVFEEDGFNVARLTAHYEKWATILNCLGVCFRMQNSSLYNAEIAAELYSAGTGIEKTPQDILRDAERAYTLYRMLNAREGFGRKDDKFPPRWFEPLKWSDKEAGEVVLMDYFERKKITPKDVERLLDNYYEEKGWDLKTGTPTKVKLEELGLAE